MPMTAQEFAASLRQRYPAYADVPDDELVSRTLERYPAYRSQIAVPETGTFVPETGTPERSLASIFGSSVRGLAKSGYNTFSGATQALAPVMESIGLGNQFPPLRDVPVEQDEETAHKIGQVAQFFVPGMGSGGRLAQMLKAGGLAKAQGADDLGAVASGAITGAGTLVAPAARGLRSLARTQYGRALGATTAPLKAESQAVVPQLLDRRVSGGLKGLMEKAKKEAGTAGSSISSAYRDAAKAGVMSDTAAVAKSLDDLKQPFFATTAQGTQIPANPGAIAKIDEVKALVEQFGPKAPPDQLWKLRKNLDDIIQASNGFGKDLAHGTAADIRRQARAAIQKELSKASPDIEGLNATYGLWKGLEKITRGTLKREEGQQKTLEHLLKLGIGGGAGFAQGGSLQDSAAGVGLAYLIRTPGWRTVSAVQKARIADLMVSGQGRALSALLTRLGAGATTQSND